MKKLLLTLCLFSTISITQTEAFASGIPVIDVAGIAQMAKDALTQANQFKQRMDSVRQQISEAKNQLDEAKRQGEHYKKMVEGHSDLFENALNDPSASRFLANSQWEDIYSHIGDISSLRDKFDLKSDDPIVQKQYDSILKNYAFQEKTYQASVERYNRITKLTSMLKSADTPAKKADLANSIEFERVQLANDNQLIQDMQELMDRQEAIETKVRIQKKKDKMMSLNW
ncbi:type IV secretion system protein [Photobacterium damselae]|uniref:type IV secretion system protein n=1 Tax=Photobacterium damselae TaxID=38293 RepID=UPI0014856C1A|nr:type IV secretion system protein [Photobacterium damselae]